MIDCIIGLIADAKSYVRTCMPECGGGVVRWATRFSSPDRLNTPNKTGQRVGMGIDRDSKASESPQHMYISQLMLLETTCVWVSSDVVRLLVHLPGNA